MYLYENMMTPYEKFLSLKKPEKYLKEGVTLENLKAEAELMSDNESCRTAPKSTASLV